MLITRVLLVDEPCFPHTDFNERRTWADREDVGYRHAPKTNYDRTFKSRLL